MKAVFKLEINTKGWDLTNDQMSGEDKTFWKQVSENIRWDLDSQFSVENIKVELKEIQQEPTP